MKEFVEKLLNELNYQKEYNQIVHDAKPRTEHEKDLNAVLQSTYDSAIRIVKRLAGEYKGGWIPVEKTLPKKSGYYTVTEEQYSLDMRKKMGVRVSHEVQFDAEEQRWHRAKFLKVIAWKEHETPYQPKGE